MSPEQRLAALQDEIADLVADELILRLRQLTFPVHDEERLKEKLADLLRFA